MNLAAACLCRRALIAFKWELLEALHDGISPEDVCRELGFPWTPELLAQAFPDVTRRVTT